VRGVIAARARLGSKVMIQSVIRSKGFRVFLGGLALVLIAPVAAQAQATSDTNQPEWSKVCRNDPASKREACLVSIDVRADTGQPIVSLSITDVAGAPQKAMLASVPTGMLIQPGLRIQVDDGEAHDIKYSLCLPTACYAQMELDDKLLAALKGGTKVVVTTVNQGAKSITFPISLAGFSTVFDGKGMDPKALDDQFKKQQKAREDAARQKLIEEEQKATGQTN